jgi:putative spermidine/putrescine transport system permease protein
VEARGPAVGRSRDLLALAPATLVLLVLFGGALAGVLRVSLLPLTGGGVGEATLASWRELLDDPAFGDAVVFTVRTALVSTAAAAALALAVALVLRHRGTALRSLVALPVPVPHLLVAVVAVVWLAPGGLADRVLGGLPFQLVRDQAGVGIVLVYVYKETPFLVLLLLAAMGRGMAEREEAAAVLGASAAQRLRWVVWPTVRTPLVVGAILVMAFVLGAFEVPLAVGPNYPPTIAEYALQATQDDLLVGEGRAAAALLVSAVAAMVLALAAVRLARDAAGG